MFHNLNHILLNPERKTVIIYIVFILIELNWKYIKKLWLKMVTYTYLQIKTNQQITELQVQ